MAESDVYIIKIYVDYREPMQVRLDLQREFEEMEVATLNCGDLMAITPKGVCLIERKTPMDFLASIGDGRLVSQAVRMINSCDAPIVIVHGDIKCNRRKLVVADGHKTRWSYWVMTSSILSLQLTGVLVIIVPGYMYATTSRKVINWYSKDSHMSKRRVPVSLPTTFSRQVEFMSALPGIGQEMANRLLDNYTSPIEALTDIPNWCKINGIGAKSVERVEYFMNWGKPNDK